VPTVPVYNMQGETVGEIHLADAVFGAPINVPLMHQVVTGYLANARQGTVGVRTRGQVSGGGRKAWRQKHTGKARQGSTRAPHWKGGGVVFGPRARDYRQRISIKARRGALRSALSARTGEGCIRVLDRLAFERPRTREMAAVLDRLQLGDNRALVVTAAADGNVYLSGRNLEGVRITPAANLNALAVLRARSVVLTQDAVAAIEEVLQR
jgi:large subunit ribosomal protein L4